MGSIKQAMDAAQTFAGQVMQNRQLLSAVAIAQLLSFLLCVMGSTSGILAEKSINAPATQSLVNYLLLAATCGTFHAVRQTRKQEKLLSNPWHVYLLLAFLDVQGNFLVTKAYQYTSITSVTLLDCFTIPAVMALSYIVFRARYGYGHLVGSVLCVAGLTLLVLTDKSSETGGPNPLLGDGLVIAGACIYAICNVTQERLLHSASQWEVLAMSGCFGSMLSGTQALILERDAWHSSHWDGAAVAALLGFAAALYCFYLLVPLVLMWGGSTVLNLSLLTSDLWAAGSRAVFFGGFGGTGLYFAGALALEAVGLCVFTAAGSTQGDHADKTDALGNLHEYSRPGEQDMTDPGYHHAVDIRQTTTAFGKARQDGNGDESVRLIADRQEVFDLETTSSTSTMGLISPGARS